MELQQLRDKCIEFTRVAVSASVNDDDFIIQAITNIEELDKVCSGLTRRVRDWYDFHFPEFTRKMKDNEAFIRLILEKDRDQLMKEFNIPTTAGADVDLGPVKEFAIQVQNMYKLRDSITNYLSDVMERHCRNVKELAGVTIGARLISEAGSLKRMAEIPSTAIQMLGAEKALFRHLKTGARPPRHGHIFAHPLLQQASEKNRGKVSRAIANKITIAARADYFGTDFIGEQLRKDLEAKFGRA